MIFDNSFLKNFRRGEDTMTYGKPFDFNLDLEEQQDQQQQTKKKKGVSSIIDDMFFNI